MEEDEGALTGTPVDHADFDAQVSRIAALGDPSRRALYRYVVANGGPVNRDQAAEGTGVPRHVAKFHMDRLVEDGLLEVDYGRPPGRRGPGAGRPAKLYRRSSEEVAVSLPERHYELAGRLLARAVTDAEREGATVGDTLARAARDAGRSLGQDVRRLAGARPSRSRLREATTTVLSDCGYEPHTDATGVTMRNCPFHALAQDYTDLVCGMNLELMEGLTESVGAARLEPRLAPTPGQCCVRLLVPEAT